MKKKLVLLLILVFMAGSVIYLFKINSNKETKETDAQRFMREYQELNGVLNDNGKVIREVSINENNPIVYTTYTDIVNRINKKETFIVYFGFAKCPWCRSVISTFLDMAKEENIDKIYYVDVLTSRDTYAISEGELIKTKEPSEGYYELLKKLDSVLSDYTLKNDNGETIKVGEKRIYAPNVVAVVKGEVKGLVTGISPLQTDAYMDLTDTMLNDTREQFKEIFNYLKENKCTSKGC